MENNDTKILGMKPMLFYGVAGVFVLLVGFGIYSAVKN